MIDKFVYFDCDIKEIAMIIHTFLKKAEIRYESINFNIERYRKSAYEDSYTLIIIASTYRMSKNELVNIYNKIMEGRKFKESGFNG